MPQKTEAQSNIRVEIEALWRTFAQDFTVSWAKVLPDIVTGVTILEGDGGLGTLLLLQFKPGGPTVPFQKTKSVEFDSTKHQLGLEVLEGGHLSNGFISSSLERVNGTLSLTSQWYASQFQKKQTCKQTQPSFLCFSLKAWRHISIRLTCKLSSPWLWFQWQY